MIIFEDPNRFSQLQQSCVATIGKFDGVHLGHQLILDQLKQKAEQFSLPSLVILIEPHPEEFFAASADDCPARLTVVSEKLELLESFGIDYVFQLKFNRELSQLCADDYIKDILVNGLGIASFIVGNDFRFGHKRGGDFSLLRQRGEEYGFEVVETAAYERNGLRISSTYIREELAKANFDLVEQLLGRAFSIKGEVVQGQQLGTGLGFPTCNINPQRQKIPLVGVYACEVRLGDRFHPAAVNIGYRPTISNADGSALLEAHILDFNEDLYGKTIEVIFRKKIRDEVKFDGLEALKQQIAADVDQVRELLNGVSQ
ncbi:MAG: bifunctional riboflavin kinase/FAD synthetase [Gammaproteobacteria bacterium]|jgi:riboflavin kinase/FMN adenylyltransferase|nr:bifunctional riboflavin kinase/FAD synthetase [Gammaproteobacteria bacterium]MBT3860016.1 bifunctional riboflavin kinase/FAD synthetase [Gammaproteobacteria bacterium]MBT3987034.1 bifunctional riboflavin kinase/FAD synthetase [Gammaproteobacteria bacterium]MBT4580701.1 bifunctional riboflavin kinase/FAD synthetase [Gammaproteobacteria bacterium]MBT4658636.1 bifunctional riboflavin kinase/FAD synthetase [Gammaproteobacteria bacterium]